MNIPEKAIPLVVQMHGYLVEEGFEITLGKTYSTLIEAGMIDESGNVTEFAIENELIEMIKE